LNDPRREGHDTLWACLRRALGHGMEAVRCYLVLMGRELADAVHRVARRVIFLALLSAMALIALVMLLWGLGTVVSGWLGVAGSGQVIVGIVILIVVGALIALVGRRAGDDSHDSQQR